MYNSPRRICFHSHSYAFNKIIGFQEEGKMYVYGPCVKGMDFSHLLMFQKHLRELSDVIGNLQIRNLSDN